MINPDSDPRAERSLPIDLPAVEDDYTPKPIDLITWRDVIWAVVSMAGFFSGGWLAARMLS